MRTRNLLLSLAAALAATVGLAASPASAQSGCPATATNPYPPNAPSVTISQSDVFPGDTITVSGTCFTPSSVVNLTFRPEGTALGQAQTNVLGTFSARVTIPSSASVGGHTILASDGRFEATVAVNVLARSAGGLPRTGATFAIPFSLAGAALVAVGTLAVLAARRRRTAAATS